MFRLFLVIPLLLMALPSRGETRDAIAGGIGLPNGGLGVEWVRTSDETPFGFALAVGIVGGGGRVQYIFDERPEKLFTTARYVSVGGLLPVTRIGDDDPSSIWSADVGIQFLPHDEGGWYFDVGAGAGITSGGHLRGSRVIPSLRFLVGRSF